MLLLLLHMLPTLDYLNSNFENTYPFVYHKGSVLPFTDS